MGHLKGHVTHMVIGGMVILAVLLVAGVDLGKALPYALLLACPLSMIGVMGMMNRKPGADHDHHVHGERPAPPADVDAPGHTV